MPFSSKTKQSGGGGASAKLPNDPLAVALRQEQQGESSAEREARLRREAEEKRVSDSIDASIAQDDKERKRSRGGLSEILVLGQSGSGKSTFVKQLRAMYDKAGESRLPMAAVPRRTRPFDTTRPGQRSVGLVPSLGV